MALGIFAPDALKAIADRVYPNNGTVGYIALLGEGGVSAIVTVAGNIFTFPVAHGLATGSRVRIIPDQSNPGNLPSPLISAIDYWAIVLTPTTLELAGSLVDAIGNTPIALTDVGTGAFRAIEQPLVATDPLVVLIAKELVHPAYTSRKVVSNLGPSFLVQGWAEKPAVAVAVNNTDPTPMFLSRYVFIGVDGSATIGDTTGTEYALITEPGTVNIPANDTKTIVIKLRAKNA
jgi:hypothetical protein